MLAARMPTRLARTATAQRSVRVNAFRPVNTENLVAAVAAGSLLLASPSFASLPEGYTSPQGSATAAIEAKLDALIEQRTGKAEALPELTEVPQAEAPKPKKESPPVVVAAPMAPAVAEPPAPTPPPRPVEVPAPAPVAVPEPPKGLQARPAAPAAAAAAPAAEGPSSGLLIGGGVAVLGVVAVAALANNNSSSESQAASPAAAAPAAAEPAAPEAATEGASAAVGGAADTTNPSN